MYIDSSFSFEKKSQITYKILAFEVPPSR